VLQLQLFSLQILHRKDTFSVKGLTVDATLLTAVIAINHLPLSKVIYIYF